MRRPNLWGFRTLRRSIFAPIVVASSLPLAGAAHSGAQALRQHHSEKPNKELTDQICKAISADMKDYASEVTEIFDECQIEEITSATGDGAKTVLADIGVMGASTDAVVVYRMERGTVAAVRFKDRKGEVSKGGLFVQGSSAMHSDDVMLSPRQHALFITHFEQIGDDDSWKKCEVHAYQWIPGLGMYVERESRKTDEIRCHR